jgi:cyclopropane-fatty-acyl-phospholipid synthase
MIAQFINAMEKGQIPDSAIRFGIRKLCKVRLDELQTNSLEEKTDKYRKYRQLLIDSPLAVHTNKANEQHYEVPAEFYLNSLGKNLKYSSCYWAPDTNTLDEAEELALNISVERAQIKDGMRILELGCGWGSLTLYMAKNFPNSKIVAISNSASQKIHIDSEAKKRGLNNILILTRDISQLESLAVEFESFDRVMSIEMFEHFKNYELLLSKIADVLSPGGKLFVHIFTHKDYSYPFETEGEDNWMGKYFFTGGQMPSHQLLMTFQRDLILKDNWAWDGTHYQKTSNAWLENMDKNAYKIRPVFDKVYGDQSVQWFNRWRVFFMACAELFGYEKGQQWGVSHYLFEKR